MPALPDLSTLRLCSLLLSIAFAGVFMALWRGRREEAYLLHWAGSSASYAGLLLAFAAFGDDLPPLLGGAMYAVLVGSNLLILSGARVFDGRPPFAPWMLLPPALAVLGYAVPVWLVAAGVELPMPGARRIGGTFALAVSMLVVGGALLRDGPTAMRGRRIAGGALFGYVPGYLVAIALEVSGLNLPNFAALLPMLSDQLLLAILNLGLLAMPGERAQHVLREAALRDPLTGAWNRAGLEVQTPGLVAAGAALILLDVDHFKTINDRHGHAAGDAVLASLAAHVAALASEQAGRLVRLGGDEFVVVLPGATPGQARGLAQRLRSAAAAGAPGLPPYTVSLGLAMVEPGETGLAGALGRADDGLYRAKTMGRDQVAV
jgi:diguanylate cyclase (GGDEF)-like protein